MAEFIDGNREYYYRIWRGETVRTIVTNCYFRNKSHLDEDDWVVDQLCARVVRNNLDDPLTGSEFSIDKECADESLDPYVGKDLRLLKFHEVLDPKKRITPHFSTATAHALRFELRQRPLRLTLVVGGELYEGWYRIFCNGQGSDVFELGQTGPDGMVNVELPIFTDSGYIEFGELPNGDYESAEANDEDLRFVARIDFVVANVQPADSVLGQQARLKNIGFELGRVDNVLTKGGLTDKAIRRFKKIFELKGPIDGKLTDLHGM